MDKIAFFQKSIIEIFEDNAAYYKGSTNPLDLKIIADRDSGFYQLLMNGWSGDDYIFQTLFHLDIKDEKIWIQLNDTDFPIEQELVRRGISPEDIILGLKHPSLRGLSVFAKA